MYPYSVQSIQRQRRPLISLTRIQEPIPNPQQENDGQDHDRVIFTPSAYHH